MVIISGPSGVGKDTILEAMQRRVPAYPRHYVVTVTTRDPRVGETPGVSYHYLTQGQYDALRDADGLLEASRVHRHWYGTPANQVRDAVASGKDAILKIDVQGADKVRERIPESLLIFVVPPSRDELRARLLKRGTEWGDDLQQRLDDAEAELARQSEFDHVVLNETDQVEATADAIEAIIAEEHRRFPDRRITV